MCPYMPYVVQTNQPNPPGIFVTIPQYKFKPSTNLICPYMPCAVHIV